MVLSLLSGCATHSPPKVDEALVKHFVGRGYQTDENFSIATTFSQWRVGEYSFDITWTVPVTGNSLPVVIYLPGLGESRTSGESWRTAWAQAGYAVLSLQLLEADQNVWSSGAARRGDFVALAHERYAKEATAARLKALLALLAELQKGHDGDEALRHRLDLSRVAIAGFDVGAYTSMLAAGEMPKGDVAPVHLPISIAAIIALSPHANFSGSAFSSRYQAIVAPVLSISGDADSDAYGIVSSPSVRKAPFEYMPSKDAYLLWLNNATHAIFSGSALAEAGGPAGHEAENRTDRPASRKGSSRHDGRHGGNGPAITTEGKAGDMLPGGGRLSRSTGSPTEQAISTSLIQGVTTAFLDAYLKQDAIAKEWLQKNARRWVGERGEWKLK